jgi:hypothetical protein
MNPALVYLNGPKLAGLSRQGYLVKVYGEKSIFWCEFYYEACQFGLKKVDGVAVSGVHIELKLFSAKLGALYGSVVRNPIERIMSSFNVRSGYWLKRGCPLKSAFINLYAQ